MRQPSGEVHPIRLSNDELADILEALESHVSAPSQSRRRSPRYPLGGLSLVVIIKQQGQDPLRHAVKARNISAHGVGFLSNVVILPGTRVELVLPIGPNKSNVSKLAVVRRCVHVRGMIHEIGVEFGTLAVNNGAPAHAPAAQTKPEAAKKAPAKAPAAEKPKADAPKKKASLVSE